MIGFARNLYNVTGTALVGITTNSEMPGKISWSKFPASPGTGFVSLYTFMRPGCPREFPEPDTAGWPRCLSGIQQKVKRSSGVGFNKQLREGKPKMGQLLNSHSPTIADQLAHSGYDWLLVDTQHGPVGNLELSAIVAGIANVGTRVGSARAPQSLWQNNSAP